METRDRELVVAVARAIVDSVDPGSVRYVEADAEAYFASPRRPLARPGSDQPLGSGLENLLPSLSVAAVYVAEKAVDFYLEEAVKTGHRGIRAFFKRRREPKDARRGVPAFSDAQIAQVFRAVTAAATAHGLDAAGADALAVAVRDRLPRAVEPGGGRE